MAVAAIIYGMGESDRVDAMLCELAARLRRQGVRLAGAIQHNAGQTASPCSDMIIEDLATGRRLDVSTPLEIAGSGCRLDPAALEDVAGIAAAGLDRDVDLVLINRYGKQEMTGQGFRALIEQAVSREIPLLTALNGVHRAAWDAFAAGTAAELPPDPLAVERWCRSVLPVKLATTI